MGMYVPCAFLLIVEVCKVNSLFGSIFISKLVVCSCSTARSLRASCNRQVWIKVFTRSSGRNDVLAAIFVGVTVRIRKRADIRGTALHIAIGTLLNIALGSLPVFSVLENPVEATSNTPNTGVCSNSVVGILVIPSWVVADVTNLRGLSLSQEQS